ncbi:MAG: hypothetical protein ACXWB9_00155 [Flavisolibacter sp.]
MKRILTLMIAVGLAVGASAQSSKEEARKVILGGGNKQGGNNPSERSRDVILGDGGNNDNNNRRTYPNSYPNSGSRVDQINREYDNKINSIRNNPNLSQSEKQRIIRELEADRNKKIRQAGNNGNNRKYKKDKKYKSNNGKHKGWSKGKGNKHGDDEDDD